MFPLSLLCVARRKVVLGSHPPAPNYWDFLSARKLGIPYTSYHCVSHPPNDKLKLTNPGEHHIALSLLWSSWFPQPLERTTLVVEWSDRYHAYAVSSHRSPLPTLYPHISLCHRTILGYYPKPISLTDLPSLPEYVDPRCPSRQ